MTDEQKLHMEINAKKFRDRYIDKYIAGQKEHSGNIWQMGAYQFLENAEDEVLDLWSYLRGIRQCLDEMKECYQKSADPKTHYPTDMALHDIEKILNRIKEDK